MDLNLLNHRDYQLGGVAVVVIVILFVFGLGVTTLLLLTPLLAAAVYLWFNGELPVLGFVTSWGLFNAGSHSHRLSSKTSDSDSSLEQEGGVTTRSGKRRTWKVTIGEEHTPSSATSKSVTSPESEMDFRRRLSMGSSSTLLGTPLTGGAGTRSRTGGMLGLSPSPAGRRASLGGSMLSPAPGSSGMPLPRVRRVHDSSYVEHGSSIYSPNRSVSHQSPIGSASATRRYPTHQAKYAGLGILPPVHLQSPDRRVLSDRNTSMMKSPVTVKIAPPDVLKPPIPKIRPVQVRREPERHVAPQQNPCDAQNVLTAIREKRKRTLKEDEDVAPVLERQDSKRRRQQVSTDNQKETAEGIRTEEEGQEMDAQISTSGVTTRSASLKRPAISPSRAASINQMEDTTAKRSRSAGPAPSTASTPAPTGKVRNPIDVSYSSSKRWLEKQQEIEKSVKKTRLTRSQSRERSSSQLEGPENTPQPKLSPRRILSLVDQDTPMKDDTASRKSNKNDQIASTSNKNGNTTADDLKTPDINDPKIKEKLFPLHRDSSSRRRHTQIRSDSNTEFNKVPTLRYTLTTEDYEKDRASEMKRVEQMLDDVEEAHAAKTASKEEKIAPAPLPVITTSAPTTTATVKPLLATLGVSSSTSKTIPSTATVKPVSVTSPLSVATTLSTAGSTSTSVGFSLSGIKPIAATTVPLLQTASTTTSSSTTTNSAAPSVNTMFKSPTSSVSSSTGATGSLPNLTGGLATTAKPAATTATTTQYSFPPLFPGGAATSVAPSAGGASVGGAPSSTPGFAAPPPSYSASVSATGSTPATSVASVTGFGFGNTAAPTTTTIPAAAPAPSFSFGGAGAPSTAAPPAATTQVSAVAPSSTNFQFGAASTNTKASTGSFSFGQAAKPTTQPAATTAAPAPTAAFGFNTANSAASTGGTTTSTFGAGLGATTTATPSLGGFGSATTTTGAIAATAAPAFGGFGTTATTTSSAPAFGTGSNLATSKPPLGSSAPSTTFGSAPTAAAAATTAPSSGFSFGGANTNTQSGGFGAPATSTTSIFGQGAANTKTTSATTSVFGQSAPSTISFGQSTATAPATRGTSAFGGTPTAPAFGQTNGQQQQNSNFQFGQASSTSSTTTKASSSFQFGTSTSTAAPQQQVAAPSPFAFGGQANASSTNNTGGGVIQFGQSAATAAPSAFGSTSSTTTSAFGSGSSSAFGTTTNNAFGSSNSTPAFGSTNTQSSNAFGGMGSQPSFGGGTQNAFGGQQPAPGGFGAPAPAAAAPGGKGFDFSSSAKPNSSFNFGGGAAPAAQPAAQPSFAFGSNNNQPNPGFNFNQGGNTSFGAPGTPQQTPSFGTPNATPAGTPNPFSPAGTPGGFTQGTGNTQPRPRTMARAARRRTTKR